VTNNYTKNIWDILVLIGKE